MATAPALKRDLARALASEKKLRAKARAAMTVHAKAKRKLAAAARKAAGSGLSRQIRDLRAEEALNKGRMINVLTRLPRNGGPMTDTEAIVRRDYADSAFALAYLERERSGMKPAWRKAPKRP